MFISPSSGWVQHLAPPHTHARCPHCVNMMRMQWLLLLCSPFQLRAPRSFSPAHPHCVNTMQVLLLLLGPGVANHLPHVMAVLAAALRDAPSQSLKMQVWGGRGGGATACHGGPGRSTA